MTKWAVSVATLIVGGAGLSVSVGRFVTEGGQKEKKRKFSYATEVRWCAAQMDRPPRLCFWLFTALPVRVATALVAGLFRLWISVIVQRVATVTTTIADAATTLIVVKPHSLLLVHFSALGSCRKVYICAFSIAKNRQDERKSHAASMHGAFVKKRRKAHQWWRASSPSIGFFCLAAPHCRFAKCFTLTPSTPHPTPPHTRGFLLSTHLAIAWA